MILILLILNLSDTTTIKILYCSSENCDLIEKQNLKIEQLKQRKNGLLQKMLI